MPHSPDPELVSHSADSKLLRVRMVATGESFNAARRGAASREDEPLIPIAASFGQRQLEAQVLLDLPQLREGIRGAVKPPSTLFHDRVEPRPDHLAISLTRDVDLTDLVGQLFPILIKSDGYISGIEGLRFRLVRRTSVELFRPELGGRILLLSVGHRRWLTAVQEVRGQLNSQSVFLAARYPAALSPEERQEEAHRSEASRLYRSHCDLESLVLRRFKLFELSKPWRTSIWQSGSELHVQLRTQSISLEELAEFEERFTDNRFAPQLSLVEEEGDWREFESESGRRLVLRIEVDRPSVDGDAADGSPL